MSDDLLVKSLKFEVKFNRKNFFPLFLSVILSDRNFLRRFEVFKRLGFFNEVLHLRFTKDLQAEQRATYFNPSEISLHEYVKQNFLSDRSSKCGIRETK